MVNTHLGIKDHISGPNKKIVCMNYEALASLKLISVELTWPALWKTVATAAIFAGRDYLQILSALYKHLLRYLNINFF